MTEEPQPQERPGDFDALLTYVRDARGFDFTGCDLSRASFAGARVAGAIFDGARMDSGALRRAADYHQFLAGDLAREVRPRQSQTDARRRLCCREIDVLDDGMGVRRPQHRHV